MAKASEPVANLSARQQQYFASIRESMKRETGKTLEEWVKIAKKCPETKHRARLAWFKEKHGVLQNRASVIFGEAFKGEEPSWNDAGALVAALWKDEAARKVYERIDAAAMKLDGAVRTARKGYTAYAREFQFVAARPYKGAVRLGLAVPPSADRRLETAKPAEGWSERLKSSAMLEKPGDVDAGVKKLLKQAFEAS